MASGQLKLSAGMPHRSASAESAPFVDSRSNSTHYWLKRSTMLRGLWKRSAHNALTNRLTPDHNDIPEASMRWLLLQSSVLRAVRYSQQLLDLEFRSGANYRYFHVPPHHYDALLAADSHGQYFNHHILNRFPVELIRPPIRKGA